MCMCLGEWVEEKKLDRKPTRPKDFIPQKSWYVCVCACTNMFVTAIYISMKYFPCRGILSVFCYCFINCLLYKFYISLSLSYLLIYPSFMETVLRIISKHCYFLSAEREKKKTILCLSVGGRKKQISFPSSGVRGRNK